MADAALIEGKRFAPACLGRVLVLGLGKSGMAATRYCAGLLGARVSALHVAGGKASEASLAFARQYEPLGVSFTFDSEEIEGDFDLCIASPGISELSPFFKSAQERSAELIGELEFAWRESAVGSRWVAVTGTNGKTTTTSLIAHILGTAGIKAAALGNIGDVALDVVTTQQAEVYVAEVSSYQLATTRRFAAEAAVILGITPDHLSWHGSMESYAQAKFKVIDNMRTLSGSCLIMDATNDVVRAKVRELKAMDAGERGFSYIPIGTAAGFCESMALRCGAENAAFMEGDALVADIAGCRHRFAQAPGLLLKGRHNMVNALAAACAASALGVCDRDIERGLASFSPLEHRIEMCGSVEGVLCCNDSKATNVDAVLMALTAFEPGRAVVLLGGCDKGTCLDELVLACIRDAKAVVCFGAAQERFFRAFADEPEAQGFDVRRAAWLRDALELGLAIASPGDTVLLSPACSSFDEFSCFEERGERFKEMVAEYARARGC